MEKSLSNMPSEVRASAIANRPQWYARLYMGLCERLYVWVGFAVFFSWWTVIYWVAVANLPFEAIHRGIPMMRDFIVKGYVLSFGAVLVLHFLETLAFVPIPSRGWPNVGRGAAHVLWGGGRGTGAYSPFHGLAASATTFGFLVLLSAYMQSNGAGWNLENLYPGLGATCIGAVSFYWDAKPPKFGLRVPGDVELADAVRARSATPINPRASTEDTSSDYVVPVTARTARHGFEGIYGMQAVKEKLLLAGKEITQERGEGAGAPPNGILLHGEPGNGKTVFAEALAGQIGVPFIELTYGDVSSKWVGEMPRVISKVFAFAKAHAPCVLFVDEIDSFLTSRDSGSTNPEDIKITNTLLTEIVSLRDHEVVLVGATNHLDRLDSAAIREGRFDYKVEITPPDEAARIGLLKHGVLKHLSGVPIDENALLSIARRWGGFPVSRLLAITSAMPKVLSKRDSQHVEFDDWIASLREVQGRDNRLPKTTKSLSDLILDGGTRDALQMIGSRLKDAYRFELRGGALPSGVLFFGPPGTGKTAAAQALAKEAEWAFLSVAGPDLLKADDQLEKLFRKAKDQRPTILFIDEGDDVLRDRRYSNAPQVVNKLLTLMGGAGEPLKDVVVIAATNHPDAIDPALLRGGRFTEKVFFDVPASSEVPRFVAKWVKSKAVALAPSLDVFDVAEKLTGQSIANIEAVLQYALNAAISDGNDAAPVAIQEKHLAVALRVVVAADLA